MSESYREAVHKMCRVTLLHRYRISNSLSGLGIYRGQPEILEYLKSHGDCSQRELAEHLGVTPASIATSIKRMSKAGFIERTPDEADRRINRLRITAKGEKTREAGRAACDKTDRIMFSGFSDGEIKKFSDMLSRIVKNLSYDGISENDVINMIKNHRTGDDKND